MICPCLSSRSKYATCGRYSDGLMAPSVFERQNYCFALYELCPVFSPIVPKGRINIPKEDCVLV
jgi:hypothetical protein